MYELKREDIDGFAASRGTQTREHGDEMQFKICPKCGGGSHRDEWTFSINTSTGLCNCMRGTCGYKANFVQLCRDFEYALDYGESKPYRQYPQHHHIEVRDRAIQYLQGRGISASVTREYSITMRTDRANIMVFPFYDEKGVLRSAKFRNLDYKKGEGGSKEWTDKDAMPILFGMNHRNPENHRAIITEGQIDQLSIVECGYDNVYSVPMGKNNFAWYANCKNFIESFTEILVFGDREHDQVTLVNELRQRLPTTIRLTQVRPQDYLDRKDANDLLTRYGKEEIDNCIRNAEAPKVNCLVKLSDVELMKPGDYNGIKFGFPTIDAVTNGLMDGQVCLITGKSGNGKSTLVSQIAANALKQHVRIFVYSGEMTKSQFRHQLDTQIAGPEYLKVETARGGHQISYLTTDAQTAISRWYDSMVYVYDNAAADDDKLSTLPAIIEQSICANGSSLIIVDNLMTAVTETVTRQEDLYLGQSKFVSALKNLAVKYSAHVLLVAHPRKSNGKQDLENDDVAGTSDVTNKVDLVFTFKRGNENESLVQITKNREFGELRTGKDSIRLKYEPKSKRLTDVLVPPRGEFGWESLMMREVPEEILPF